MAGSETYTVPRDWSAGETVTAALLNTHIRDILTYIKGVLTGSNLQDVTINAAKSLLHGTQHVLRSASTTKQHVEAGSESFAMADLASTTRSVTFAKAFGSAPLVVLGTKDATKPLTVWTSGESTTGFTLNVSTSGYGAYTGVIPWIALGAD
jgi:hypothetical protein